MIRNIGGAKKTIAANHPGITTHHNSEPAVTLSRAR
jgi:hypothetical protein